MDEEKEVTFDEAFDEDFDDTEEPLEDAPEEESDEAAEEEAAEEDAEPTIEERLAELERERDDWKHKFESNQGRVAAMQREFGKEEPEGEAPTDEQVAGATDSDESWDEFVAEFPEFAKALESKLTGIERKIGEKVGTIAERLDADTLKQDQADFDTAVGTAYKDWKETIATDDFRNFLDELPKSVQQLYYSDDPADAIYLLDQYGGKKESSPQPNSEVKQRNQNRLKRNVSTKRSGTGGRSGPPDDFDSAFDYYANQ